MSFGIKKSGLYVSIGKISEISGHKIQITQNRNYRKINSKLNLPQETYSKDYRYSKTMCNLK